MCIAPCTMSEVIAVGLPKSAHSGIAMLLADLTVNITVPIVQTGLLVRHFRFSSKWPKRRLQEKGEHKPRRKSTYSGGLSP